MDRHAVSPPGGAEGRRLRLPGAAHRRVARVTGETVDPLPPYTPDWAEANGRETLAEGLAEYLTPIDPKDAREGDIVLFRWRAHLPAKHAGILTAPDSMVHAQAGAKVSEVAMTAWWRRRVAFGFAC